MNQPDQHVKRIVERYLGTELEPDLFELFETVTINGGEWLFQQGDPGDSLFFLIRGRLQAWAQTADAGKDSLLLGEVVPGDSVGEVGLLSDAPRSAGIRAIRDSQLVKLSKAGFETVSARHPEVVLKLAGQVAKLLQKNLFNAGGRARKFSTLALLPLEDLPFTSRFVLQLSQHLEYYNKALLIGEHNLEQLGAPVRTIDNTRTLPDNLRRWLADLEDEHPLVVFICQPGAGSWNRYAVRQSDVVVNVADTSGDPELRDWEDSLKSSSDIPAGRSLIVLLQSPDMEISNTLDWVSPRSPEIHLHVMKDSDADIKRVARVLTDEATGLVLGAGAARGLAQLGAYKAIREAGISVDWFGGCSIGSIMAAGMAKGWDPDHVIEIARESFVKGKPFGDFTLPVVSVLSGGRMKRLLLNNLDVNIEDLRLPYFCVSSNLDRGTLHIHESGSLVDALRASAALPGILPPAVVNNELAVDGAVLNNLPVDIMQKMPVAKIIAVDVSARHHRQVSYPETPSPWAVLKGRWLPFTTRYRVPSLATIILRATEIGTLAQSKERGLQADLLLNPPVRKFGMTEVKAFDRLVQVGYEEASEKVEAWIKGES